MSVPASAWADNVVALPSAPALKIRPEIQESWKRSATCGLERDQEISLPYDPVPEMPDRLSRAATPVLDELGDYLADAPVAVMMSSSQGRLVYQRCENLTLARELDRVQAVRGHVWQEQYAGTNALGVALEGEKLSWVDGREHYLERLTPFACAAAAIVHPLTQRLQGVIALAGGAGGDIPLMVATVRLSARAVEEQLYQQGSAAERTVLSRFLAEARRSATPVLALCRHLELANPAASRLLGVADKALLWERAADAVASRPSATITVSLSDRHEVTAHVERLPSSDRALSLIIRLTSPTSRGAAGVSFPAAASASLDLGFVGRTDTARYLRGQARHLAGHRLPVCVSGEPGTGKLTLARSIAMQMDEARPPVVLDAARSPIDGESRTLRLVGEAVEQPRATVIVQHVDCLGPGGQRTLGALAASAEALESRVLMTRTTPAHGDPEPDAVAMSALDLRIPALRERIDDLFDLVPFLIARRSSAAQAPPALMRALLRYDWPGNVGELDCVVRDLISRARGVELSLNDLPATYHGAGRRLGRMEHVERAAIVRALQETGGSKSRAAELLGIGRATLYRKLRAYGLDLNLGQHERHH